jgi:uncharacterized protein
MSLSRNFVHILKSVAGTAILGAACFLAASCASRPELGGDASAQSPATGQTAQSSARQSAPRMFWTLSSPSGGSLYIQGTLHLGSDELFPFNTQVTDSMKRATVVLGELSSADLDRSQSLILERMSFALLDKNRTLTELLSADERAYLEGFLGKEAMRNLSLFMPWVAYSYLDGIAAAKAGLDVGKGVDMALYSVAAELGKAVGGLESVESQLDLLTGPQLSTQLLVLKDAIREYKSYPDSIEELYAAYRADDRKKLSRLIDLSLARSEAYSPELGKFNDSIYGKRNAAWAAKLAAMLDEGKSVFVFAGVAHFVGADSVIDLLVKRGYKLHP